PRSPATRLGRSPPGWPPGTGRRTRSGCPGSPRPARRDKPVDSAYFEDLAGRLYGLLIGLDDRIGREQAQWLHHVIDVGEYGLALEDIAGTLAQDAIAVTDQERGDMMALAAWMNLE